ncbi:MAG: cell division protein ZapA [Erythrobacter sp.]
MIKVTLSIGTKSYTVACADGEEAHLRALGAMIAEKYAQIGSARAPLEAQNMLFAALFMADELNEARARLAEALKPAPEPDTSEADALRDAITRLQAELAVAREAASRSAPPATPAPPVPEGDLFGVAAAGAAVDENLAEQLEALAVRVEANAVRVEANADALEAAIASA